MIACDVSPVAMFKVQFRLWDRSVSLISDFVMYTHFCFLNIHGSFVNKEKSWCCPRGSFYKCRTQSFLFLISCVTPPRSKHFYFCPPPFPCRLLWIKGQSKFFVWCRTMWQRERSRGRNIDMQDWSTRTTNCTKKNPQEKSSKFWPLKSTRTTNCTKKSSGKKLKVIATKVDPDYKLYKKIRRKKSQSSGH